jgi:hypothetical protein
MKSGEMLWESTVGYFFHVLWHRSLSNQVFSFSINGSRL